MDNIAVFCGSAEGYNEVFRECAYKLGEKLAARNTGIIYGGARIGLMGAIADGGLAGGGKVTGIIPGFLKSHEVVHMGLTRLITVDTMHERKMRMHEMSDAVIALPGAWGTMDELFEILTWGQLGLHGKPVGILNINGYYDALIALFDSMVQEGFLNESTRDTLIISNDIDELLYRMEEFTPPEVPQILTRKTT